MYLEKIISLKVPIVITILAIVSIIITFLFLGMSPETVTAIATIALVVATIYIAYFNMKLWIAQDKPWIYYSIKEVNYHFINEPSRLMIFVKNVGKGAALDVQSKVDEPINKTFHFESLSPNEVLTELLTPIDKPVDEEYVRKIKEYIRFKHIQVKTDYSDINGWWHHQESVISVIH